MNLPSLDCIELTTFPSGNLEEIQAAFSSATPINMQQAWLDFPEPTFLPATVRTAWHHETLLVLATMPDLDIYNTARTLNERTWTLGDVFEVFLQKQDSKEYVEFHVTPDNIRLQLAFPGLNEEPSLLEGEVFRSKTWVLPEQNFWIALLEIPCNSVVRNRNLPNSRWRFSFSRYDYTRGMDAPVISSTSPHAVAGFHRLHEWGTMRFIPTSATSYSDQK